MRAKVFLLLIIGITIVSYFPSLENSFVYDDRFFIEENPHIRNFKNIPAFFLNPIEKSTGMHWSGIYRPIRTISYALDYKLWGLESFGYHLTNLLLHILNIIFVFCLAQALSGNKTVTVLTTALFALYPAHSEAVHWLGARADMLAALFSLPAIIFFVRYLRGSRYRDYCFFLLLFIIALFSKEIAIMIPVVCILISLLLDKKKKIVYYLIPLSIAFLYFILRQAVMKELLQKEWWGGSFYTNVLTVLTIVPFYLSSLIWPYRLSVDYTFDIPSSLLDANVLISLTVLVGAALYILCCWRRKRMVIFGLCWFILFLLPALNIVPLTVLVADRFLYLSSIGIFLAVAVIVQGRIGEYTKRQKGLLLLAATILFSSYAVTVYERSREWRNGYTLFSSVLRVNPRSWRAYQNIGTYYLNKGMLSEAETHFQEARRRRSDHPSVYKGLGVLYFKQGKYPQAAEEFKKAISLWPEESDLGNLLAITYDAQGKYREAFKTYRSFLEVNPLDANLYKNLANLYLKGNKVEEAIAVLKVGAQRKVEDAELYYRLGILECSRGNIKEALIYFHASVYFDKRFVPSYRELARVYREIGKEKLAETYEDKLKVLK